ncbi:LSM domain containing protein [Nitzschia inconspicua]|uniref:LSM domain containing protein n=1 Tax=Nitzschia inconspicua TaxID=303405 RepID=A0A9K3L860_9STRA|nr:LSM domain containing protein [Nitzschia inconspicua]
MVEEGSTLPLPSSLATQYVQELLGEKIVCTLDDGRTVKGTFICIDRLSNIILTNNVVEERTIHTADYSQYKKSSLSPSYIDRQLSMKRHLGQAMIPGSRLVKVELEETTHEQILKSLARESS